MSSCIAVLNEIWRTLEFSFLIDSQMLRYAAEIFIFLVMLLVPQALVANIGNDWHKQKDLKIRPIVGLLISFVVLICYNYLKYLQHLKIYKNEILFIPYQLSIWSIFVCASLICWLCLKYSKKSKQSHKSLGIIDLTLKSFCLFVIVVTNIVMILALLPVTGVIGDFIPYLNELASIAINPQNIYKADELRALGEAARNCIEIPIFNNCDVKANGNFLYIMLFLFYFSIIYSIGSYCVELFLIRIEKSRQSTNPSNEVFDISIRRFLSFVTIFCAIFASLYISGVAIAGLGLFSGLIGAGISIALRDLLNNFVAGLIVSGDNTISVGDFIEIDADTAGTVEKVSLRFTTLKTRDRIDALVPNSFFVSNEVKNYTTSGKDVRISIIFTLSANVQPQNVVDDCEASIYSASPRILRLPINSPKVFYRGSQSNGHSFDARVWINDPQQGLANIRSEVNLWLIKKYQNDMLKISENIHISGELSGPRGSVSEKATSNRKRR